MTKEQFFAYLSANKQFIMQHLMKLFYYCKFNKSDGVRSPFWTKRHWMNEILEILEAEHFEYERSDFNKLMNALYVEPYYDTHITCITSLMQKDNTFDAHKLPMISERILKRKWKAFCTSYHMFIYKVCSRMLYSSSLINSTVIFNYWMLLAKKCSDNEEKLVKLSKNKDNFSDLTEKLQKINKDLSELI